MLNLCVVHHPPLLHESVEAKVLTPVSFKFIETHRLDDEDHRTTAETHRLLDFSVATLRWRPTLQSQ
jgi:hypothetical protein